MADELIPAADGMPGAGEAGAVAYLEQLARDDDVRRSLRKCLALVERRARSRHARPFVRLDRGRRVEVLAGVERSAPAAFAAARNLVYEGYYTQAAVTSKLGFEFVPFDRPAAPLEAFDERTVARVAGWGRSYRQVG